MLLVLIFVDTYLLGIQFGTLGIRDERNQITSIDNSDLCANAFQIERVDQANAMHGNSRFQFANKLFQSLKEICNATR